MACRLVDVEADRDVRLGAPAGVVGVVRRSHSVEVELLHELDVLHHGLLLDRLAAQRVVLVPVDACASRPRSTWAHPGDAAAKCTGRRHLHARSRQHMTWQTVHQTADGARLRIENATQASRTSDHDASVVHQQLPIAHLHASESNLRFATRTLVTTAPQQHAPYPSSVTSGCVQASKIHAAERIDVSTRNHAAK